MPFIWFNNIGVYTSVKLCVLEEKQDQSPSPLCAVIKPTAGSSHYAIRARRLTMFCGTAEPYLSIFPPSPQHLYIVKKFAGPNSPAANSLMALRVFVVKHFGVTHHLSPASVHILAFRPSLAAPGGEKCPHVFLG